MLRGAGDLLAEDTEKAEALNAAFVSAFAGRTRLWEFEVPKATGKDWRKEDFTRQSWIRLGEHLAWTWTMPWELRGCTHGCFRSWPMSLRPHSIPLKGDGHWRRFMRTGRKKTLLLCSRRARRSIWSTTGSSASPQSLERKGDGANNPGNHFQAREGQEGDWKLSAWICTGEIMPNQPDSLL